MGIGVELDQAEALMNAGRISEAAAILTAFVARKPRESRALHMLGVTHAMLGQQRDAEGFLQRARALKPQAVRILTDLAIVLIMLRRDRDALALLDKVRKREPELRLASFYTGVALANLERHSEALEIFGRLSQLEPDNDLCLLNYATVLGALNRFEEAEAVADRLLMKKTTTEALLVKGFAAISRESLDEAIEFFDRVLARDPDHAEAAYNRAGLRLLKGDLAAGWPDYEARLRRDLSRVKPALDDVPHWAGEPLGGKSLLVYAEQGLGDILLICRYLPPLAELGCNVFFLVPAAMTRILRGASDGAHIIDKVPEGRSFDFQIPMMSLPHRFATSIATIPGKVPYLFAEPQAVEHWRKIIGVEGFKIGIAWQGNPAGRADIGRSIPLADFRPLSQIPGVRLISLQKNHGLEQVDHLPAGMTIEQLDSSGSDGFIDTAAIMMNMDLIVTSDTSIANLAGALGLPAWIVLKRIPDWRWLLEGEQTPWFPTLKLFRRERQMQDWRQLLQQIADRIEGQLVCAPPSP
ncbi:tetratricopeptide repeat protein [Bradyrhizobium sp. LHD-71]|uniref:tetratricopeptide repeat protein n=1 Tax=Bradyrhizobium sp. LHD-71 TaxID=3072141 RepID=UPI00280FB53D|nr:tetratricopeptide repeat protein [Bradyrhizobium sp. LHD-71]MDQ8726209.1 tetratricopeptide repeat protein [Bradyrhizobium sp. LHD-71]